MFKNVCTTFPWIWNVSHLILHVSKRWKHISIIRSKLHSSIQRVFISHSIQVHM
jgi:hypothetical protein